jgi:hypothetical protein
MAIPADAKCATCRWWGAPECDRNPPAPGHVKHACMFNAPIAAPREVRYPDQVMTLWPLTSSLMLCGQWEQFVADTSP